MNLVAIGGGDVGSGETESIDRELVRLATLWECATHGRALDCGGSSPLSDHSKPREFPARDSADRTPRLLFVPTASNDAEEYVEAVTAAYGRLGCEVEALRLWGEDGTTVRAREKILRADAIYVGGGNTKAMLELWRELGIDILLREHLDKGKPAGGLSAGALCWFRVGNSDWPQYEGVPNVNTDRLDCLGFVDLVLCPHTAREGFRLAEFREMMKGERGVGVGLDDCCAIQVRDDEYRILASQPGAVAHRVEWRNGALDEREMPPHEDFRPIRAL